MDRRQRQLWPRETSAAARGPARQAVRSDGGRWRAVDGWDLGPRNLCGPQVKSARVSRGLLGRPRGPHSIPAAPGARPRAPASPPRTPRLLPAARSRRRGPGWRGARDGEVPRLVAADPPPLCCPGACQDVGLLGGGGLGSRPHRFVLLPLGAPGLRPKAACPRPQPGVGRQAPRSGADPLSGPAPAPPRPLLLTAP